MLRSLMLGAALTVATCNFCYAAPPSRSPGLADLASHLQIVIKACNKSDTKTVPINQGKSYDDVQSMSDKEREAIWKKLDCIDVPLPMHLLTAPMLPSECRGQAGYLASMQYLQSVPKYANRMVGGWGCIISKKSTQPVTD
jgi:hypothetical protein